MPTEPPRAYLDANVLLAFVADEEGRAGEVQSVLAAGQEGKIELVTSVLSIAEVAFVASDQGTGEAVGSEEAIAQLWVAASPINLVDVSTRVALQARAIIRESRRQGMRTVKPADAIHLVTAAIHGCHRFFTYERAATRQQWSDLIHISVDEPYTNEPRLGIGEATS